MRTLLIGRRFMAAYRKARFLPLVGARLVRFSNSHAGSGG